MLKNRYDQILVGMNVLSLIRGLISCKRSDSVLLIHDKRFHTESYSSSFISELEIHALHRIGKLYEIPELVDLRPFLTPAKQEFTSTQIRISLGQSPFENLKELLRKFPDLCPQEDLDLVFQAGENGFNDFLLEELKRFEFFSYDLRFKNKKTSFEFQGPQWFRNIYTQFEKKITNQYRVPSDLRFSLFMHLAGVAFEDKIKSNFSSDEISFYFLKLLSPVYRLQDFFLMNQLKRRFLQCGGDFKESIVQYWQLYKNKFENLLLASFEGVITGKRVLFFSHFPVDVPFQISSNFSFYRKTQLTYVNATSSPYQPHQIIYFSEDHQLGSERPFRMASFGNKTLMSYEIPYLDLPGTKAEFYNKDLEVAFNLDSKSYPFPMVEVTRGISSSVTTDLRQWRSPVAEINLTLTPVPIDIVLDEKVISGFEYWGSSKFRNLGFLALCYGVEAD